MGNVPDLSCGCRYVLAVVFYSFIFFHLFPGSKLFILPTKFQHPLTEAVQAFSRPNEWPISRAPPSESLVAARFQGEKYLHGDSKVPGTGFSLDSKIG